LFACALAVPSTITGPLARASHPLFLAKLRFCVHYCIDRDAVPQKKNALRAVFWRCPKKINRASRGFLVVLSTKKFRKIWKQDNQTNVVDLTMRTFTTQTQTDRQTRRQTHTHVVRVCACAYVCVFVCACVYVCVCACVIVQIAVLPRDISSASERALSFILSHFCSPFILSQKRCF